MEDVFIGTDISIPNPSIRGRYSTRLEVDNKLDDIKSVRENVKHFIKEEFNKSFMEEINKCIFW